MTSLPPEIPIKKIFFSRRTADQCSGNLSLHFLFTRLLLLVLN